MKISKIKFNTIALSIMFILICFCLCGCAQVNFVTYHNDDGTIQEYVYLTIDEQALSKHGYNVEASKMEIQSNSHLEAVNLIEAYRSKLVTLYQSQQISSDEYSILYNGVKLIEQKWENNEYIIGLQFDNSSIYQQYYELLNGATFSQNTKQIEKPFYTKTYYYGTTNYGDYTIFNRIYSYYVNSRFNTISPQEAQLTYSYSVSSRRFHSNAEQVSMDSNGNYIHTWDVDPNQPAREIYFYTISANRSAWIIVCVLIGLAICAILCIIAIFKHIKAKNSDSSNDDLEDDVNNDTNQQITE